MFQSSIPPHLGWRVNHEDVTEFGLERSYPSNSTTYLGTTLYITTLGLQFWVKKMHFRDGKVMITIILGILRMIIYLFTAGGFLQCFHSSDFQYVFYQSCGGQVCFHLLVMWWAGMFSSTSHVVGKYVFIYKSCSGQICFHLLVMWWAGSHLVENYVSIY